MLKCRWQKEIEWKKKSLDNHRRSDLLPRALFNLKKKEGDFPPQCDFWLHDFAQELQYEIQSKRNMTGQNLICLTLRPWLTTSMWTSPPKAKLIPPTTTRTRTCARGTPTEQPVRRVSVQLLRGSLINNMGSRAFGSLGNKMGRRTRSSPAPDGNH